MDPEYDKKTIHFLEQVWGDGFMSPGGVTEIEHIIDGLDLTGKRVLDLGCGSGGITIHLAENHDLEYIVGFDVEQPALDAAVNRKNNSDYKNKLEFIKGTPGPLPFSSLEFDVVFSKDALIHIENKLPICAEIYRILRDEGVLACSDWLVVDSKSPSVELSNWLESEGFEFLPATIKEYEKAIEQAGLSQHKITNRNKWHIDQVKTEVDMISNKLFSKLNAEFGEEFVQQQLNAWEHLEVVAKKGDLFPAHIRAKKVI